MTQPQKNSLLALAVVLALASLKLPWMIINVHNDIVSFYSGGGGASNSLWAENGVIHLLLPTPFWVIVAVIVAANVMPFMRNTKLFAIPVVIECLAVVLALVWLGVMIWLMAMQRVEVRSGVWVALVATAIPAICLMIPTMDEADDSSSPVIAETSDRR